MPATEQTWRNSKLLHKVFAVSSVVLLFSTIWMFAKDHNRPWKHYQKTSNKIDITTTEWRTYQFQTDTAQREQQRLEEALRATRRMALDVQLLEDFRAAVESEIDRSGISVNLSGVDNRMSELDSFLSAYEALRSEDSANEEAVEAAGLAVERARDALVKELRTMVEKAKFRETTKLGERKFKSADLDAAKANVGLAVRDGLSNEEVDRLQGVVDGLKEQLAGLSLEYEALNAHRAELQGIVDRLTADELAAEKAVGDNQAELERLLSAAKDKRSTYFNFVYGIPMPGKKMLESPILDAFNSPLKIDNLWSDGLTQDYNFSDVRRFDRCTTCHRAIDKTQPGTATQQAFPESKVLTFALATINDRDNEAVADADGETSDADQVEAVYGLRLAAEGVLNRNDVTVQYVQIDSLAAKSELQAESRELPADEVLTNLMASHAPPEEREPQQGLILGDVVLEINGDPVSGRDRAVARLLDAAKVAQRLKASGKEKQIKPLTLTVRRGLPHPYASHPRLDLFVGSLSPHKMSDFACTICHEGQGSATEFKWASHTPNSERDRKRWQAEHGWFDNHHWIYPQMPKRFAESTCLKCHHDVVELEPSEKFPDPPAPTLMHGYHLFRKYGCYGCHEVNGYDAGRRIGPDLRLEPNYYAAALELAYQLPDRQEFVETQTQIVEQEIKKAQAELDAAADDAKKPWQEKLNALQADAENILGRGPELAAMAELATQVGEDTNDDDARHRLLEMIRADVERADGGDRFGTTLTGDQLKLAAVLNDVDSPGTMRKSGPSLRYVAHKVDGDFLYDWIDNPKHFRPSTRMPRFFGQWNHLDEKTRAVAERNEPIEVQGIVTYLQANSQPFDYLQPPEGISDSEADEQISRGKMLFQTRGCLACHNHQDFSDAAKARDEDEIVQGPDLSGVGEKFVGEKGHKWLYSWLKKPNRYHVRTVMPDLYLDPIEHRDADGNITMVTDPAADIVAYLLAKSKIGYSPAVVESVDDQALDNLVLENLKEAFHEARAKEYLKKGIPARRRASLKAAETSMVVSDEQYNDQNFVLSKEQKLLYIGRKSIGKYGCYGCHDIAGFEDAKPIGTGLADWGRKDPSKLAFEHIVQYLEHGHGSHDGHGSDHGDSHDEGHGGDDAAASGPREMPSDYYLHQIQAGNRIGFIYQKLTEPRSYDYHSVENKRYNERLRMPLFPFDVGDREAVITFVLGLVADPPTPKYVYQPDQRQKALNDGRVVLEKFNCGACHILEAEKWEVAYAPGTFREQNRKPNYPFADVHFTAEQLLASSEADRRGMLHATLTGMPTLNDDGQPIVFDSFGDDLYEDEQYDPKELEYAFQLWAPVALNGNDYQVGESPLNVPGAVISRKYPTDGGFLAKYLIPHVVKLEKQANPNAKGSQAWGWVPPPLVGQGSKTQSGWLHNFLLDPQPIRPAVFLRMPKFNMSSDEATKLVNYFSARDNADYPYEYSERQRSAHLQEAEQDYRQVLKSLGEQVNTAKSVRFDHAMQIVTNKNYCITCHIVGDFVPKTSDRAKAPNLADVYSRLRTKYVRTWVANPMRILPYTGMPVNIPFDPAKDHLGGVSQELFHGTSVEQLDGVVDLLMNYDQYAQSNSLIAPLVAQSAAEDSEQVVDPAAEAAKPSSEPEATSDAEKPAEGKTKDSAEAKTEESSKPDDLPAGSPKEVEATKDNGTKTQPTNGDPPRDSGD